MYESTNTVYMKVRQNLVLTGVVSFRIVGGRNRYYKWSRFAGYDGSDNYLLTSLHIEKSAHISIHYAEQEASGKAPFKQINHAVFACCLCRETFKKTECVTVRQRRNWANSNLCKAWILRCLGANYASQCLTVFFNWLDRTWNLVTGWQAILNVR